jgi:DNA ligase-1
MAKKEFVQLAHVFEPAKHTIAGSFMSQKLDGERAIWDGGISRGYVSEDVPYANSVKDHKRKRPQIATGLWSRTGKIIFAPDWFLDSLPKFPLDGELWAGMKNWQQLSSIVSQEFPDDRWRLVEYKIIDSPPWTRLFAPRDVKVRNDYTFQVKPTSLAWAQKRSTESGVMDHWSFEFVLRWLSKRLGVDGQVSLVPQIELPFNNTKAIEDVERYAQSVVDDGGEGVVIRKRTSLWTPERSWDLLKFKPLKDDEAIITGYYAGKETDKGSKLLGLMGALEINYQGSPARLSGFTNEERQFSSGAATDWARNHPGERCPDWIANAYFPVGGTVTFTYRELSDDGVPKEARYLRKPVE